MKYDTIEELMEDVNTTIKGYEKKVLDEFYDDKRREIKFLKEHIKSVKNGKYKPKPFERRIDR